MCTLIVDSGPREGDRIVLTIPEVEHTEPHCCCLLPLFASLVLSDRRNVDYLTVIRPAETQIVGRGWSIINTDFYLDMEGARNWI